MYQPEELHQCRVGNLCDILPDSGDWWIDTISKLIGNKCRQQM
ncbi:hypothetical protein KASIA_p026 [Shewanella phage vB_SspS_KASIA]|nr:hypothetical protein KASIA_p026 [Shewanella phage vB_SspS_KASIA]